MIGVCSIDTTCTIWDLEKQQTKTQLIAHDKEVFDFAFANDTNLFATVGADSSLRLFDMRTLEHSTILYEAPNGASLLRLVWNKLNHFHIATIMADSNAAIVLDVRMPAKPFCELHGHSKSINAISWAPHSASHLSSVAEDQQTLIWDISVSNENNRVIRDPILAYTAQGSVNNVSWDAVHEDYIAIAYENNIQYLKV